MKYLLLSLLLCTTMANANQEVKTGYVKEPFVVVNGKAYKAILIDGEYYASNEFTPMSQDGYTNDYFTNKKYHKVRLENQRRFKVRGWK